MKFRAAVLNKVNEPMTFDTLEMAPLSPTDVLVKVKASEDVSFRWGSLMGEKRIVRSAMATRVPAGTFRGSRTNISRAGSSWMS